MEVVSRRAARDARAPHLRPWALIAGTLSLVGCGSSALAPAPAGARDGAPGDVIGDLGSTRDVVGAKDVDGSSIGNDDDAGRLTDAADTGGTDVVDASSLNEKMLLGYQGWFLCPGDGSSVNGWTHWFRNGSPTVANLNVDFWPDTSELAPDELFATSLTYAGGATAMLYSAFREKTVVRHFQWMKESGIDGVVLQRFLGEIQDPRFFAARNQVTANVRLGAETFGRVFAIEYDISTSAANEARILEWLQTDWQYMVDTLRVTESSRYLRHKGKPVLLVWGFGFSDRAGTPADAQTFIDWLKTTAAPRYQATVVGGVPTNWRTATGDSKTDPAWASVYRSFDVISPWTVGRYALDVEVDNFRTNYIVPDLAEATRVGAEYMPVVFPGFSWHNLNGGPTNQIPRRGGRFYWRQVYNAVSAGAKFLKTAMFDEVDEGTAMYKVAPSVDRLPAQGTFVTLDADGIALPSDWYLRLGGQVSRLLRQEIPPSVDPPITP